MKNTFRILFVAFIVTACQEIYQVPPSSQLQFNLYKTETESSASSLLTIKGVDNDSIWLELTIANSYLLPLGTSQSNSFHMLIDSVADTLTIYYNYQLAYESIESGFYYTYHLNKVESSKHKIDSVALIDTIVNELPHENIQIFLNDSTGYTSTE